MADLTLRSCFNRWRDLTWVQSMRGVVVSVACFAVSRETGRAIPGSDYSVTYSDSDSADSDSAMFPKGSPPPPAGRDAAPIVAKNAPPKAGRDQVPRPKPPPPILLAPLPPKMPSPPRALMIKPPPPIRRLPMEVQIRRTNSLPTMKSPPMALSIHRRPHQSDLLQYPKGYRHPVVEPPRAPLIPDNPRGDEPEPARPLSRSHSWPVRKEWLTRWPLTLTVFRRSNSDSCLWERSWGEEMDYRDSLIASS